MQDVNWNNGISNTRAVIKHMNDASRYGIPASSEHLERLKAFENQVLNMEHPTCPLGWERHTQSVKSVEDDYGVAWRDQDGYFCAPPGAGPDETRVSSIEEEKAKYSQSPTELRAEIRDLTRSIRSTLDPEFGEKYKEEEAKKFNILAEIQSKQAAAASKAFEQRQKAAQHQVLKDDEHNTKMLEALFKKRLHLRPDLAKAKAVELLEVAKRCLDPTQGKGERDCKPILVPDPNKPGQMMQIWVPKIIVDQPDSGDTLKPFQAWWRKFRKSYISKLEADNLGEHARYM